MCADQLPTLMPPNTVRDRSPRRQGNAADQYDSKPGTAVTVSLRNQSLIESEFCGV